MKTLASAMKKLKKSNYLQGTILENRLIDLKLLENAKLFCNNLIQNWKTTSLKQAPICMVTNNETDHLLNSQERFEFVNSEQFQCNLKNIKPYFLKKEPVPVIKEIQNISCNTSVNECSFLNFTDPHKTQLISDYFVDSWKLGTFYNIQRERKIWWMKLSTNPSHYIIEPYTKGNSSFKMQSVTMQSKLFFADIPIEEITHVSLCNNGEIHRKLQDLSVIRSIIHLEAAACALLIDAGIDTSDDSLPINNKLVPYQCSVICFHKEKFVNDLEDLRCHLLHVLNNAGVKLYHKDDVSIKSTDTLQSELSILDNIGIPYIIILEPSSLDYGLMKLRNRDTTLSETIHISDLPEYLLLILR